MDLPPTVLLGRINDFSVVFFRDTTHEIGAPPHWHVVIPAGDAAYLIAFITSQKDKRVQYYSGTNRRALNGLVEVDNDTLPFLARKSVIDCNRTELLTRAELLVRVDADHGFRVETWTTPEFLKKEIVSAIQQSPLLSSVIKKAAKDAHPRA